MERIFTNIFYWIALLLMVYFGIRFIMDMRKFQREQMANKVISVTCRKCGCTFEGTQDSLQMGYMHKETSTTRTKVKGPALVNVPTYTSYSRKVYCPYCQSREWADINNVNEIAEANRKAVLPHVVKLVAILLIINAAAAILTKFVQLFF